MTTGEAEPTTVTVEVSTGVVFELTEPSIWAVNDLRRRAVENKPEVPTFWNPEAERNEENPAHPDYAQALDRYEAHYAQSLYEICISTGAKATHIPTDFGDQDSDDFRDLMEAIDFPVADSRRLRYLQWVKYMAAPKGGDHVALIGPLLRFIGTTEEDVAEAAKKMGRPEERQANNGSRVQRPRRDGADVRAVTP